MFSLYKPPGSRIHNFVLEREKDIIDVLAHFYLGTRLYKDIRAVSCAFKDEVEADNGLIHMKITPAPTERWLYTYIYDTYMNYDNTHANMRDYLMPYRGVYARYPLFDEFRRTVNTIIDTITDNAFLEKRHIMVPYESYDLIELVMMQQHPSHHTVAKIPH